MTGFQKTSNICIKGGNMSHEYYYESVQKQQHLEEEVKHLEKEMDYLLWEKTSVENEIEALKELINKVKERL